MRDRFRRRFTTRRFMTIAKLTRPTSHLKGTASRTATRAATHPRVIQLVPDVYWPKGRGTKDGPTWSVRQIERRKTRRSIRKKFFRPSPALIDAAGRQQI